MNGRIASAVLLLTMTGCTLPDALSLNFGQTAQTKEKDLSGAQYVAADFDAVVESTKGVLKNLNIEANIHSSSDKVVFRCATRRGKQFMVTVERWPTKDGMNTRIDLAWDGAPDDAFRAQVLTAILALCGR